jgi:phospholipid/cholesterol/gamma-HCH transport system substrate-binding protein
MRNLVTPFKVGLLVLVAGAAFLVFFTFVHESGLGDEESVRAWALFDDASGLGLKSRVQTAGIAVGEVTAIRLEGTRARVELRIRRDVPVKVDAVLYKRSESVLGDYLLDLVPGSAEAAPLPDGARIVQVVDRTGMDEAFDRLNRIAGDIQAVTSSLRQVLGGEEGTDNLQTIVQNMVELSANMDRAIGGSSEKLNAILTNLEAFSADVRSITAGQEQNYDRIVANVRGATEDVRDVLRTVKQVLGSGEGELKESVASLKATLARLDSTLRNVESVTAKIDEGEGALAQLINDRELGDQLRTTMGDASDFVGKVVGVLTEVTLRSEFHLNQRGAKNYLQLRVIPKPDKYYLFEIVDDPRGKLTEETVLRLPPDADQRELQTQLATRQGLKFTAQFAKRYYFATLRFGIIESTGGVGANLHFLDDALSLNVDLFEFSAQNKDYPRLKAFMNFSFLGHLFLTAGIDDALNRTLRDRDLLSPEVRDIASRRLISGRDLFLGAGVYFTDDDLKALLAAVPLPGGS